MELKAGYKQTEIGVIPEDWSAKSLSSLISLGSGFSFSSTYFSDKEGTILLTPGNFRLEGGLYFENRNTKRYFGKYPISTILKNGELVVVMTDLTPDCNLLGKPAFIESEEPLLHNQRIGKVQITSKELSDEFLYYVLLSSRYLSKIKTSATGSTVRHTSNKNIYEIQIPIPPLNEQRAIATALADVDALLAKLDALIAKKRDLKQAAMQQLLTAQTRLPGFSGEWEVKRLGDLCERITTGKLDANAMVEDGEYPFFTCAREHYWIDNYGFDNEVLLVSGNGANVGYVHYYNGKFNAYQRTYVLLGFNCCIQFMKLFMERNLQDRIRLEVNAGNTPYIVMGTLTDMQVSLPKSIEEQTAIATILSDMDAEITALEARRDKTRTLKQGMMQELLTGRIRLV